jgi:hypothetical protein
MTRSGQWYLRLFFLLLITTCNLRTEAQNFTADVLTGRAVGSIPIWTVNSGDVSAGVSLNYTSNAKVNDSEMAAGMGWNLSAGGAVTRIIRGLPDDFVGAYSGVSGDLRNGWLHGSTARQIKNFIPSGDLNYSNCSDEVTDYNALNGFTSMDTEPDVFSFQAPGLNGQFIFDNNKVIQTIPYQDLNIQVTRESSDSLINQIVITNNQGFVYTFQAGDKITRTVSPLYAFSSRFFQRLVGLYKNGCTYYNSWHLTQVTSPKGGKISLTYGNSFTTTSPSYLRVVLDSVSAAPIDTVGSDSYTVTSQLLQGITGSNETVSFVWTGGLLSSIAVTDLAYQTSTKLFNLQYHYVWGSKKQLPSTRVTRAYLSGLTENLACNAFPGYSFNYYGVNFATDTTSLPFNSGLRQDLFGYYDSTAVSENPDIYISSGDVVTNGERYRIAPASNYSLMGTVNGARTVNPSKVYFGSLKTVTLPSGGTTTFTYEASDYFDVSTSSTVLGGGSRVKKIKTSANDPGSDIIVTYKYSTANNAALSSGQWLYRPMFVAFRTNGTAVRVPDNQAPDDMIYYSRVEASTSGRGRTVYEFQNSGMYGTISQTDYNASLTQMARMSQSTCVSLGNLESGYYTYPHAQNTNYDFERGLPTHVTDYNRNGKLVQRKNYTYQRTTLAVNQISGLRFEVMNRMFQFSKYALLANVDKKTLTEETRIYDQAYTDTTTQFVRKKITYTYNGNQMLSQTATTNSDNSVYSSQYTYAKDYATTGTDTQSQMINALVAANRHGTLVETVSMNGGNPIGASLTLFNNNYGTSTVLPSQQLVLGDPTGFVSSNVSGTSFNYSPNYYTALYYDAYDALGHALILRDQSRSIKSTILGCNNTVSVLDIANARYDQVAFADFEPGQPSATCLSGGPTINTDSWSGQYCTQLSSIAYVSQSTVVRGNGKNYRVSCWAKASASTSISVVINGATSATLSYGPTLNTWQYMEATIDMSAIAVGTNFGFKLTAAGNINIDNLVFYPESAMVTAHAYDPLNGKTGDLDSRGVSAFVDYDALGRVHYVRNMDKDITQIKDYHYQSAAGVLPVSSFVGPNTPNMSAAATYAANTSCLSGVTYAWYVDGVAQTSTGGTLTYTFTVNKTYHLTLVASGTTGSASTQMEVNPVPVVTPSMTLASGELRTFNCSDTNPRDLTVTVSGCYETVTYTWYALVNNATILLSTTTTTASSNSYSYTLSPNYNNSVYCVITTTCTNQTTKNKDVVKTTTSSMTFTWVPGGPC